MLTLDKIYHAAFVLKDIARRTDLIEAPLLSKDCHIYLKTENLQVTGSFKVRGAYYKISQLSEEERSRGVIACSAGNHAQGVALAATRRGIKNSKTAHYAICTAFMALGMMLPGMIAGWLQENNFAPPEYSRDNAMGIAILAKRALERGEIHGK